MEKQTTQVRITVRIEEEGDEQLEAPLHTSEAQHTLSIEQIAQARKPEDLVLFGVAEAARRLVPPRDWSVRDDDNTSQA